jgi:hypothetical protein
LSCENLVRDHGESKDVNGPRVTVTAKQLRRLIAGGTDLGCEDTASFSRLSRKPEVADDRAELIVHQDVAGLQVPMDNSVQMQECDCRAHSPHDDHLLGGSQCAATFEKFSQ